MLGYLFLDIICSLQLTVFLELRSRKTVRHSEQIMSADKYPSLFSRKLEAIVYIVPAQRKCPLKAAFSYSFLLDKMKKIYRPMSNLVRREQEE